MKKIFRTRFSYSLPDNRKSKIQKRKLAEIVAVAVVFALCGAVASAQQPKKVPRIGYLLAGDAVRESARSEAIRLALRERGYIEGQNIAIEYRYAEGKWDRLPELASELVRLKVDIIVTGGPIPVRAAQNATKTIPIVMRGAGTDPVEEGLVESLARPGGNVTGLTLLSRDLGGKRLELFKEAVPKLARVAALYDAGSPSVVLDVKDDLPVAARAGVDPSALGGTQCGEFRAGIGLAKQAAPGWALRILRSANAY
jgi:putative tryptophan/tyrosine transport system substrate-binding protein